MRRLIRFLFLFSVFSFPIVTYAALYKHVSVAPKDMYLQALSNQRASHVISHSSFLPLFGVEGLEPEFNILRESSSLENVAVIGEYLNDVPFGVITDKAFNFAGHQFQLLDSSYLKRLPLLASTSLPVVNGMQPKAFVLVDGDPRYSLVSTSTLQHAGLGKASLLIEASFVFNPYLDASRISIIKRQPEKNSIRKIYAQVLLPSKRWLKFELNDNGENGDAIAADGRFSALLPYSQPGSHIVRVYAEGRRQDGVEFNRTTYDVYSVADRTITLADESIRLSAISSTKLALKIPVDVAAEVQSVFVAAELWGNNAGGRALPAAWVGGLSDVYADGEQRFVLLGVDARWIQRRSLMSKFHLRNLRLQDRNTHSLLDKKHYKPLHISARDQANFAVNSKSVLATSINKDMLMMPAPLFDPNAKTISLALPPTEKTQRAVNVRAEKNLVLVHGYCEANVWNENDFTSAYEYKDYNSNRSHDEFALRLLGELEDFPSYSMIGHSQGGAVALHIYAKYQSGMDNATGGRLIQSVGTPYQGTALAGIIAVIGEVFGLQCGANRDLTYAGSADWLSTIPGWARAEVDYYTTSFTNNWWSKDFCDFKMGIFLRDPDDGVVEKWAAQLPGGVNQGHKEGWCHSVNMREPAQYFDEERNAFMDQNAAR